MSASIIPRHPLEACLCSAGADIVQKASDKAVIFILGLPISYTYVVLILCLFPDDRGLSTLNSILSSPTQPVSASQPASPHQSPPVTGVTCRKTIDTHPSMPRGEATTSYPIGCAVTDLQLHIITYRAVNLQSSRKVMHHPRLLRHGRLKRKAVDFRCLGSVHFARSGTL